MNKLKFVYISSISASFTIGLIALITVSAELSPGFKDMLKGWTGHHWVSKSWLTVIIYAVCALLCYLHCKNRKVGELWAQKSIDALIFTTIASTTLILAFFIRHS